VFSNIGTIEMTGGLNFTDRSLSQPRTGTTRSQEAQERIMPPIWPGISHRQKGDLGLHPTSAATGPRRRTAIVLHGC
jgi:hypothetical protein